MFLAALFLAAGTSESAAVGLSGVLVAMMAASLVLGVPGGVLADALGPARGLAFGAWARLFVIAAALFAIDSAGPAIVIAFTYSAASQLFSSAELAFIRVLEEKRPARGHALLVVLQYGGQGAGLFLAGPALYYLGGEVAMVLGALVTYAAVGFLTLAMLWRQQEQMVSVPRCERKWVSLRPTLRFFAMDPAAAYASGLLAFFELALKGMAVAIPIFLFQELRLSHEELGALAAPTIAGAAAGFWLAGQMEPSQGHQVLRPLFAGMVALTGMLAVISQGLPLPAGAEIGLAGLVPVGAGLGVCLSLAPIGARAVLTHRAPAEHQASVFATQGALSNVAVILPLTVAGVGTEMAGTVTTFLFLAVAGGAMLIALELCLPRLCPAVPVALPEPAVVDLE